MCYNTVMKSVCGICGRTVERKLLYDPCEDAGEIDRFGQCSMGVVKQTGQTNVDECGSCKKAREKGKGKAVY
ncbi:hypothetical protein QQX98_002695 [Neonectria punicea]|uniref:Uncharacterized protein n=1 Tax=Neonectria punicea TaxID=979145 RepID=A0ABR1HI43_9HYPO